MRHNYQSIQALNAISNILRVKEDFPRAVEYLQTMLKIDSTNGEVWGSLGHCFLMMEDLQQAYHAYQNALFHLRDPKVKAVTLLSSDRLLTGHRSPNFGTALGSSMIAMALSNMPRRRSLKSC